MSFMDEVFGKDTATRGSSGAPGVEMPTRSATARAAASSIPSVTRRARAAITPRPRPGKIRALLA